MLKVSVNFRIFMSFALKYANFLRGMPRIASRIAMPAGLEREEPRRPPTTPGGRIGRCAARLRSAAPDLPPGAVVRADEDDIRATRARRLSTRPAGDRTRIARRVETVRGQAAPVTARAREVELGVPQRGGRPRKGTPAVEGRG